MSRKSNFQNIMYYIYLKLDVFCSFEFIFFLWRYINIWKHAMWCHSGAHILNWQPEMSLHNLLYHNRGHVKSCCLFGLYENRGHVKSCCPFRLYQNRAHTKSYCIFVLYENREHTNSYCLFGIYQNRRQDKSCWLSISSLSNTNVDIQFSAQIAFLE